MKKLLIFCFVAGWLANPVFATDKPEIRWYGFLKSDFFVDTRDVVAARQGQFYLYPQPQSLNAAGDDLNENFSFHFLAIQTRLGLEVKGPYAFGAQSRALIEGAFFGNIESDINGFRLRHAFVEFNWDDTHRLMLGQFWHPLFVETVVPGVVSFNTGAPFKPFARNPQIRYTRTQGSVDIITAAMSQIDFVSQGGTSDLRFSGIPNLHSQIRFNRADFHAGLGVDWKRLRPNLISDVPNANQPSVSSLAVTAFGRYQTGKMRFLTQHTYGGNLFDHLMLGGYALIDSQSPELTDISVMSSWLDYEYGSDFSVGLFAGFTYNLGTTEDVNLAFSGPRGANIAYINRIAPRVQWQSGPARLSLEFEATTAAYGTPDNRLSISDEKAVTNYRLLFAAWYFF